MAQAHCMHYKLGYKHKLRRCNTYSFTEHQWLRERVTMLRHTYFACIVTDTFCIPTKPQAEGLLTKQVQENLKLHSLIVRNCTTDIQGAVSDAK